MRLTTIRTPDGMRAARVDGDAAVSVLPYSDVGELLADPSWRESAATGGRPVGRLDETDVAPVVPEPSKIICLAHNFRSRLRECGEGIGETPTIFSKFADALIGPYDDIVLPRASTKPDWEVELGVFVGEPLLKATPAQAGRAIAGYTVVNDISMRDWETAGGQWLQSKTFGATTPVGPVLTTPDELPHHDGVVDVELRCEVEGELRQRARTSDLAFTPVDLLVYLSGILPLRPGDLVSTGTPSGVGEAQDPPTFLEPEQVVRSSAEGIGACVNTCVKED